MPRAKQTEENQSSGRRPEKKFGPYPGGIGVAVWLNAIHTDRGPRWVRSITISPRRYRDPERGEWKDSPSFRPTDLPALLFGLQKAQEYVCTMPIPGQDEDHAETQF
jgi:hypothetical protein